MHDRSQTMRDRYLILNADDFGMAPCVNRAVQSLFRAGAITAASLLAPAEYAREAAAIAQSEGLPVGVHWTLHSEWADAPWPLLSQANGPSGHSFAPDGLLPKSAQAVAQQGRARDVRREMEAQYERLLSYGIRPSHADCHGDTLYGTNGRFFFLTAFDLCRRYRLPFRFPSRSGFLARQLGHTPSSLLRAAHRTVALTGRAFGVALPHEFLTNPLAVAQIPEYNALRTYYLEQLAALSVGNEGGIVELFMHPSEPDEAMLARTPEWQKRVWEYEFLKSGELQQRAKELGFVLTSWADPRLAKGGAR